MDAEQLKAFAVTRAAELGFVAAGVADAGAAPHADAMRRWIDDGRFASMDFMARHADKRCDTRVEWPWARSVLCLAAAYGGAAPPGPVARYARGRDYHKVLKGLCRRLADEMVQWAPALRTRICVDTAPIAERDWAAAAGVGWVGAHGCVIHPTYGSYLLLAEILLSVELPADAPIPDRCGSCRRCLDACPNGALLAPRVVDARRCVSWATIENRGDLDGDALDSRGWVFGCDLCQQACPYNRDAPAGPIDDLLGTTPASEADLGTILAWSVEDWDRATRGSAMRRASHAMVLRNAAIAAGRAGRADLADRLSALERTDEPIVRRAACWALRRLAGRDGS